MSRRKFLEQDDDGARHEPEEYCMKCATPIFKGDSRYRLKVDLTYCDTCGSAIHCMT